MQMSEFNWVFVDADEADEDASGLRWIVQELDDDQRPTGATYRYWYRDTAMDYGKFLVKNGRNVAVYEEIGYCINEESTE